MNMNKNLTLLEYNNSQVRFELSPILRFSYLATQLSSLGLEIADRCININNDFINHNLNFFDDSKSLELKNGNGLKNNKPSKNTESTVTSPILNLFSLDKINKLHEFYNKKKMDLILQDNKQLSKYISEEFKYYYPGANRASI